MEKLTGNKVRSQLAFRRELARLLIDSYNGYKRPSSSGACAIQTLTSEENLKGRFLGKLQGRKKACAMCAKASRKRDEKRTFETSYGCAQCGVPLCRQMRSEQSCFSQWHGGN